MANRFLDTNYYKSRFVRSLKGPLKSLYSFIICDCDGAGIWNLDLDAASMYTGFVISHEEFNENFVKKGKAVDLGGERYFFPDFIEHQYPKGLQDNNKAHKNFIQTLKKFNLLDEQLHVKKHQVSEKIPSPFQAPLEEPLKASQAMSRSSNGNGQVMVYDAEKEVLKNQIEFERMCMTCSFKAEDAKTELRRFHLHLEEKDEYPRTKKSIFAGFEKWLMNDRKFYKNGKQTNTKTGRELELDKP